MAIDIWVAKRDGTGWTSNRTRDAVDLAFTVSRNTPDGCKVEVRCTWYNDPKARARRVIGYLCFDNHIVAKHYIENYVKQVNDLTFASMGEARAWFLDKLLDKSNDKYKTEYGTERECNVYHTSKYHKKSTATTSPAPMTPSSMASTISSIAATAAPALEIEPEVKVEVVDISSLRPGDPAPAGYIWLGKKLVQLSWPS